MRDITDKLGHWTVDRLRIVYNPNPIIEIPPEGAIGFIYRITERATNKYYIGKKLLFHTKKLKPRKGLKNKRHKRVDSDWRSYTGSGIWKDEPSDTSRFDYEIIKWCDSKTELALAEVKSLLLNIYTPECKNQLISCKIRIRK